MRRRGSQSAWRLGGAAVVLLGLAAVSPAGELPGPPFAPEVMAEWTCYPAAEQLEAQICSRICAGQEEDCSCNVLHAGACGCSYPGSCGDRAPSGCYCDAECDAEGDCCLDAGICAGGSADAD